MTVPNVIALCTGFTEVSAPVPVHSNSSGLAVGFRFAHTSPHPSILVTVVGVINSGPTPISDFVFQAAVPKTLELKLEPPSGTAVLPARGNTLTQVMLISNPSKVRESV